MCNAYGGAIYNGDSIGNVSGDFINNHTIASLYSSGGGIYNDYECTITSITVNFIGNYALATGSNSNVYGGAIYNWGTITVTDGSFINNYAEVNTGGSALGGAIYAYGGGKTNLVASNNDMIFSGNYISNDNGVTTSSNAIYIVGSSNISIPTILNLNANIGKLIVFNDSIDSDTTSGTDTDKVININATKNQVTSVNAAAPTTGTIVLNNDMSAYKGNVNLYGGTIKVGTGEYSYTDNSGVLHTDVATTPTLFSKANAFNVNGGTIDFTGSPLINYGMGNVVLNSDLGMKVDADLANSKMQTIRASSATLNNHNINVNQINLLSDATSALTTINFADSNLKSAVAYTGTQGISYSPLYKYNVAYDSSNGDFNFTRAAVSTYNAYNPTVYSAGTAAQTGGYIGALATFNEVLSRIDQPLLDMTMLQSQLGYDPKLLNKTAQAGGGQPEFSPLMESIKEPAAWFRPYTTFENVPLNNGPTVSNVAYGGLFGGDSGLINLGKGYKCVVTAYGGYNGSHQTYDEVSLYQNGGFGGLMGTLYKGDLFSALTANAGASDISSNNNSDFGIFNCGVASRTGYNFKMLNNKLVFQPNYLMSYTFVNTQDYTNYQGVSISTDPLNAIQISPSAKLIFNLPHSWQLYLRVGMVWNLLDDSKVTANNIALPEVSVDPYVQYGAGVEKKIGNRFTGFFQTMVTNGGRNGVSLLAGFKWII